MTKYVNKRKIFVFFFFCEIFPRNNLIFIQINFLGGNLNRTKSNSGGLVEQTQAYERIRLKELGKMPL